MSEPVRLLDLDGDPMGASLLRSGLDDMPPPGAKDDVFRSIQGALGVAVAGAVIGGAAGVATHASAATATNAAAGGGATAGAAGVVKMSAAKAIFVKLGIAKTIGVVGLCSATIVGGVLGARELVGDRSTPLFADAIEVSTKESPLAATGSHEATPSSLDPASRAVAILDPVPPSHPTDAHEPAAIPGKASAPRPSTARPDTTVATAPPAPEPDASVAATPTAAPSGLGSESAGVTEVRAKLRAGDAGGALALLSAMQKQFGGGRMSEDRAVLAIEALAASGNTSAARANADAFLKAHPKSPYASRVRTYASN